MLFEGRDARTYDFLHETPADPTSLNLTLSSRGLRIKELFTKCHFIFKGKANKIDEKKERHQLGEILCLIIKFQALRKEQKYDRECLGLLCKIFGVQEVKNSILVFQIFFFQIV